MRGGEKWVDRKSVWCPRITAVEYGEKELREQVKAAGGKWDPAAKMWRVSYGGIKGTELEKRIHAPDRKGKRS